MDFLFDSKHWDAVSEGYKDFVGPIFENFMGGYANRLELSPSIKVLDLACGPGTASFKIHDRVGEIHGLDFSEKMISVFNDKISKRKINNVKTHVGDGQDLSRFPDGSFDVVISLFGLIFFPDRVSSLKEIRRVLKPKGRLLITSWQPMMQSSFMSCLSNAINATGCVPSPKEPRAIDVGTPDPEVFVAEFLEAGFKKPTKEAAVIEIPIDDVDEFWKKNVRGSIPIHMVKEELGEEKWNELSVKAVENLKKSLVTPCSVELRAWVWTINLCCGYIQR